MQTAENSTVSIPIMDDQRTRRQLAVMGREGLENLIAAVRKIVELLLAAFRFMAKVVYSLVSSRGESDGAGTEGITPVELSKQRRDGDGGMDDVAAFGMDIDAKGGEAGDVAMNKLLDKVEAGGGGTLDLVMTGAPEELQLVMPMLMRHVEQILTTHMPVDADESKLNDRLVALAETSESARYAHRIVSRQIGTALRGLVGSEQYMGLSESTVIELVRAGAKGDGVADLGGRSAEEQLLAALQLREKLERDFSGQAQQMARLILDAAGPEEPGNQQRFVAKALEAAETARFKLRIHEGGTGGLAETLPEMRDELQKMMAQVQQAAMERAAFVASLPAVEASDAAVALAPVETTADSTAVGEQEKQVETMPAPAPHVPQAPEAAVKAAVMAKVIRVASAGGMFGGQAQAPRSAKELAEAAEAFDFDMEEEGGEQPFVAG